MWAPGREHSRKNNSQRQGPEVGVYLVCLGGQCAKTEKVRGRLSREVIQACRPGACSECEKSILACAVTKCCRWAVKKRKKETFISYISAAGNPRSEC